jgi:hypothetical protein
MRKPEFSPADRADLFAVGAVVYYLLTARLPYTDENGLRPGVDQGRDWPIPPSMLCSKVPADLTLCSRDPPTCSMISIVEIYLRIVDGPKWANGKPDELVMTATGCSGGHRCSRGAKSTPGRPEPEATSSNRHYPQDPKRLCSRVAEPGGWPIDPPDFTPFLKYC